MVTFDPAIFEGDGEAEPSDLTTEQVVRLYVEAELGIPLSESMIPPSAERDKVYAVAVEWWAETLASGRDASLPFG